MSIVGSPFGNCWGTNSPRPKKPVEKREEQSPAEEPQETYRPRRNEPFGNCWGTNDPKPKPKSEPKPEPKAEPRENYGWDPREPFRYPGNI